MNVICPPDLCTGCAACLDACQRKVIAMAQGFDGVERPRIDENKCVDCGACRNLCPTLNPPELHTPRETLVATARDLQELLLSSSGAIATVLAQKVIEEGGTVYGSTAIGTAAVHHIRIDDNKDLDLIRGSKYVQSHTAGIYAQVKADLHAERRVLFVGTPCQVAALRTYLRRPQPHLITIDLVCHGTPPPVYLESHIQALLSPSTPLGEVRFRTRTSKGTSRYGLTLLDPLGRVLYTKPYPHDVYIEAFMQALTYRTSCYSCPYARPHRTGDITLGDYWSPHRTALNMVLVNTPEGQALWASAQDNIETVKKATLEDFCLRNDTLTHPMPPHPKRQLFLSLLRTQGFTLAAKTSLKVPLHTKIRRVLRHIFHTPTL